MLFVSLKVKKKQEDFNGKKKALHTKEKIITVFYAKEKKKLRMLLFSLRSLSLVS